MSEQDQQLRATIERLVVMPPIRVEAYDEERGSVRLWFSEAPAASAELRFIDDADRLRIRAVLGTLLERWHRAAAAQRRVWQIRERELTSWKSAVIVSLTTPPAGTELEEDDDPGKKAKKGWKAPSQWQVEAQYRTRPDYARLNTLVEQAEEAHGACLGVIDALQHVARLLE